MTSFTSYRKITRRKREEEILRETLAQLSKKNKHETIISTVTRSVHESISLQDVLENAAESLSKNIDGVDNVSIYMVDGDEEDSTLPHGSPQAVLRSHRGYNEEYIRRAARIPYPKGTIWETIINGKPRCVADAENDSVIGPEGREIGTKSYVSLPIHFEENTVGVITIDSLKKNAFDEEGLKLLEIVAQQIEVATNNAKRAD